MKNLYLIDGMAIAYRSYFSFIKNPLKNKRGMETGAIYGFTTTLLRLLQNENPDYIAVVLDSKEPTFRHQAFPSYKATREKMPDEMSDQIPYIKWVTEALRIPILSVPSFEADDIIGTLIKEANDKKIRSYMVSGDKDFLQLVNPNTFLYTLKKGGEVEILGENAPELKWGVPAHHVIDLLALMGDSSDNVPGVPGIGEKTACKLISEFGSLERIYENLNNVKPQRIQDKLREFKEQAFLCKTLVTIHTDVPLSISVEELKAGEVNRDRLIQLYDELDFRSLRDHLMKNEKSENSASQRSKRIYKTIRTHSELDALIAQMETAESFCFDTETNSLHVQDNCAIGISISMRPYEAFYVPLLEDELSAKEVILKLKPLFESRKIEKGGQNVKFDYNALRHHGIQTENITFDTMLESYLLDPGSQHNLDDLALKHLGIEKIPTESLIGKGKNQIQMSEVDLETVSEYACEDADVTLQLHEYFAPKMKKWDLESLYQNVELPMAQILGKMEWDGIKVDVAFLKDLSRDLTKRQKELEKKIFKMAGEEFNIQSPKQLGPILFEKLKIHQELGINRVKKTKTGYATDQDTLEKYSTHPLVRALLEFRNLSKLRSTYADALPALVHPKTGKIHSSFNQTIAATGRLSSSDPNLQNIPIRTDLGKKIRKAFIPSTQGWSILSADYSQVELRILAHMSEDSTLIETFQKNEDVHRRTAAVVFGVSDDLVSSELRSRAKAINFGILYGMGPQRLSRETGITLDEAKLFIEQYFARFSKVRNFIDSQIESARDNGFVRTLLGRKRNIPDILNANPRISANAERIAVNTPIQGSAADLIKLAMINIDRKITSGGFMGRMLIQVHDELVFECPDTEVEAFSKLVKDEMENAMKLSVPLVVEVGVGQTWADAH